MPATQVGVGQVEHELGVRIDALRPELERIGRAIYANPEIGYEEHKAVGWLSDLLQKHGFSVEVGITTAPTAFVASQSRGDGPTIAFLAEYDALAGLGHGCGHNLVAMASCGAGIALADLLSRFSGSVLVIGAPAEEGGAGKIRLIREGILQGVDAAMMFHPGTRTQVLYWALPATQVEFEFIGRAAHASGNPEKGVNALDAFVSAYNGISLLRQQLREGARVHVVLREDGAAPNIIPERTSGDFLVQARDISYVEELKQKVKNIFHAAALATGCSIKLTYEMEPFADMCNNDVLAGLFEENLRRLGLNPVEGVPWENAGSTYMGNLSHMVPAIQPTIAIVPPEVPVHSRQFLEASDSPLGYQAMIDAAKALAMTGADLLRDPSHVEQLKKEFQRSAAAGEIAEGKLATRVMRLKAPDGEEVSIDVDDVFVEQTDRLVDAGTINTDQLADLADQIRYYQKNRYLIIREHSGADAIAVVNRHVLSGDSVEEVLGSAAARWPKRIAYFVRAR